MPTPRTTAHLERGKVYHVYNRGINGAPLFNHPANYHYFISLSSRYLLLEYEILAYCLMQNHFHFILKVRDLGLSSNNSIIANGTYKGSESIRRLCISYTQAYNKQQSRSGSLFMKPFRRKEITTEEYLKYLYFYIHYNPVEAGITKSMKAYLFSSYKSFFGSEDELICPQSSLHHFNGSLDEFDEYHQFCIRMKKKG